jgi:putative DNA primase/helicase
MNKPDQETNVRDAALGYADRGWPVIPLNGKKPVMAKWTERATDDPDEIGKLFSNGHRLNLGLLMGERSGVWALDVDPRNDGDQSLRDLEAEIGALPETVTARTGGGGRHFLFKMPKGDFPKIPSFRPGLDIQAGGSQIVVAPSVHPDTGKPYVWERSPDDFDVAETPPRLLALLRKPKTPPSPSGHPAMGKIIGNGERNERLAAMAGALRRQGATEPVTLAALRAANEKQCDPPLPDKEVRTIAHSISRYEPAADTDPLTDDGNALRFARKYHGRILFCRERNAFLVWTGKRWKWDPRGVHATALGRKFVRGLTDVANHVKDPDEREEFLKHAIRSQSHKAIVAMVNLARSDPKLWVDLAALDRHAHLLNVLNGTVDLRSGELLEHTPDDLITHLVPADYDPEAPCPTWKKFLLEVMDGDKEMRRYVQTVLGYSITGERREQAFFVAQGVPGTGKSTVFNTVRRVLGEDLAKEAARDVLHMERRDSHTTSIADLRGKRFVKCTETGKGRRLDSALLGQLTGDEAFSARKLYEDDVEAEITFKIFLLCNEFPGIDADDQRLWERIHVIPFAVKFRGTPRDDVHLDTKLDVEREGILAWLVRGATRWYAQEGKIAKPAKVTDAACHWNESVDTVRNFVEERCTVGADFHEYTGELYQQYRCWAVDSGERRPKSINEFAAELDRLGFLSDKRRRAGIPRLGLKLK